MKVYFTCSTAEFQKYKDSYFNIRDIIVAKKHVLTRDWLHHTEELINAKATDRHNIESIYQSCMTAIKEADLVIIEDTVSNFSTGHQISVALQKQKPILVLWQKSKQKHFKQMFIHGIKSDLLEVKEYDNENVEQIISQFLKKYENGKSKNRFHLILNQVERDYLDWAQFNKNLSRTQIIRNSIQDALKSDEEYGKYLEGG